ncbi:MAG TPA: carboxypeptidase regulatory-like domain-containing protein [Vicinamibacterales bacterium]|nr:carboxypeptidase regulatory-like domain-containing protein [Vicinamibacterales bacterium]
MIALLLLTLLQAPAAPPAKPAVTTPAPQAPRPRPSGTATTAAMLFITDGTGKAIENVTVNVMGPVDREVKSPASGATRIEGLRAGTYRVRFTHDKFITFEKELAWRAGTTPPEIAVTLNAAPEQRNAPSPAPAPPVTVIQAPSTTKLPPPGTPKTVSLPDFIEKNFISGREPQKENLIGCSGVGQALLWQIREPWNSRQHDGADGMVYVVGGEGRLKLGEREFTVSAGAFAVVPRGTSYSLSRSGRNPLIVLAVLAGAPCAAE